MTKLVQPNVLRAYQSGEQYAINELVLYNSVPAYTNTALAQGVAGTAGNFTNIGSNTFSDSLFRIQDNGDATKQIAFEASPITSGVTRTITMGDANVDLGTMVGAKDYGAVVTMSNIPDNSIVLVTTNMTVTVNDALLTPQRSKWYNTTSVAKTLSFSRSSVFYSGNFRIIDPIIGAEYGDGFFSITPFAISYTLLPFATIDIDWGYGYQYEMRLLDRTIAYPSQWKLIPTNVSNSFYGVKFATSGAFTTSNRTITIPDANVNLGLIGTVPAYVNGAAYVVGNEVTYLGILYICGTAHTSNTGSPDLTKFYPASGASNLDKYGLTQYYENYVASTGIRKVFKQYASTFDHTGAKTMTVDIVLGNNISWYNNGMHRLYNIKVMAYKDDGFVPRSGALIMDKRVIVARGTEASADTIIGIPLLEDIKTYLFGMFSASTFTANIIDSGGSYHLILTLTCPNISTTVSAIMLIETISCD